MPSDVIASDCGQIVKVNTGAIAGVTRHGVRVYLDVPYAAAPRGCRYGSSFCTTRWLGTANAMHLHPVRQRPSSPGRFQLWDISLLSETVGERR